MPYFFKPAMNFSTETPLRCRSFKGLLRLAASSAAVLLALAAQAQPVAPEAAAARATTPSATTAPVAAPRYAAADLKRAFDFMDANHDGKISREEAARFRGVAKNFDRADTNHDQFLSRQEFDRAMNYVKPQ